MICQVMWLYHLNTGHPYCPVFRWIRCSVFRWLLYTLLLCWVKKSSKKVLPIILYLTELWHVCFSDPTCRSKVPEAWFNVRQTYSLSSLAFKRVTRWSAITNTFPLPLLPKVHKSATGRLEQTNNLGNLGIVFFPINCPILKVVIP